MDHRRRFSVFVTKGYNPRSAILEAIEFTRDFIPNSNLDERAKAKVAVVVEELVANSLRHGGKDRDLSLSLELNNMDNAVVVELEDDGAAFNLSQDPAFAGPDPLTGGGVGLAIVRAWGEDITYTRSGDRNVLRLLIR